MPHLSGRCPCGRPIHWPKDAGYGDEWRCFRCGRVWTLCQNGELPLHNTKSQPPPPEPPPPPPAAAPLWPSPRPRSRRRPARRSGPGCLVVILLAGVGLPLLWLLARVV